MHNLVSQVSKPNLAHLLGVGLLEMKEVTHDAAVGEHLEPRTYHHLFKVKQASCQVHAAICKVFDFLFYYTQYKQNDNNNDNKKKIKPRKRASKIHES
jgi:hypothetical protein